MDKFHFLDAVLVSAANVLLFIFLDHYLGKYIVGNIIPATFLILGVLLFIFHHRLSEMIFKRQIRIAEDLIAAISYILIFMGLKSYIATYLIPNYIIIVGVIGLVLFVFHDRVVGLAAQIGSRG